MDEPDNCSKCMYCIDDKCVKIGEEVYSTTVCNMFEQRIDKDKVQFRIIQKESEVNG